MDEKFQAGLVEGLYGRLASVMGTEPALWSGRWVEGPVGIWIQSTFRGAGQVIFMDNPISGVLIVVGTLVDSFWPGLLGLVALAVSTLFGLSVTKDSSAAKHGLHGYNAHLVGCLVGRVAGCDDSRMFCLLLLPTIIFTLFSNVVFIALGNVLVRRFDVPPLTLPFNIAAQFWIATMSMSTRFPAGPSPALPLVVVESVMPSYDIFEVLQAIPKGIGQVWLCDGLLCGCIIWLAVLVCSPISAGLAALGSMTGTLCAVVVGASESPLYDGVYGYNAVLGAVAVGGIFNNFNVASIIAAIACGILCTSVQFFMAASMAPVGLGVMTLPFCIGTLLFLLIGDSLKGLTRVPVLEASTPEEVIVRKMRVRRQQLQEQEAAQLKEELEHSPLLLGRRMAPKPKVSETKGTEIESVQIQIDIAPVQANDGNGVDKELFEDFQKSAV